MTRDEAVAQMKQLHGFRTDLDVQCVTALQQVQRELEEAAFLPWFLRTEVASISTTADEERVPLPSDFLRETEDTALWYYKASNAADKRWILLKRGDIETLRYEYQDTTGEPEAYSKDQAYFRIKPTPNAVYTLKMGSYFAKDAVLTSNIENKWLTHAPFLMLGKAGQIVATAVRDAVAYKEFAKMEAQGMQKLIEQDTAYEMANNRPVMGGED